MSRLLITGAGGASAISLFKSLAPLGYELFLADIDPTATGLYLVDAQHRVLVPRGDAFDFAEQLLDTCAALDIDLVIPTVDCELVPVSERRSDFEGQGTVVLIADPGPLHRCVDKLALLQAARGVVRVGRFAELSQALNENVWRGPWVVKPRTGAGSRGITVAHSREDLRARAGEAGLMVQEWLPGAEYSVDVLTDSDGHVIAAVPRERVRIDSGIAVCARTVRDPELQAAAQAVVEHLGLTGVANVQFRRDHEGRPVLMEINPRFPGTMPLTVAAGVPMPELAVAMALGAPAPGQRIDFEEVAVVRYLEERVVSIDQLGAVSAITARLKIAS